MIPQKYFYTIGDVCKLTGTKPHILRYWESQFRLLRPARRYSGHRKYTQREIDLIQQIKHLIVERKYTLAGAKKEMSRKISGPVASAPQAKSAVASALLLDLKKDVDACLDLLQPAPASPSLPGFPT
jgi:DNA-binding transcriptional MerR regulator